MEIIISKFLVEQCAVNLQPSKHESWWRRLEDVLKMPLSLSSGDIFKTSWSIRELNSLAIKLKKILYFLKKNISYIWSPLKNFLYFQEETFWAAKIKKIHSEKISSLKKNLLNFLAPKVLIIIFMLLIKLCYTPDKNPLGETGCFSSLYLLVLRDPVF